MINHINAVNAHSKNYNIKNSEQQSFKGISTPVVSGLRQLNNSPAIGACVVDLFSMVIPRTLIEFKNRGMQSGIEAAAREGSSCLIHANVGLIGLAVATMISKNFNQVHNIKAQNIFASGDTIKNMAEIWQTSGGTTKEFFGNFIKNLQGLNGNNWNTITAAAGDDIVNSLTNLAAKTQTLSETKGFFNRLKISKEVSELKNLTVAKIVQNTGAQSSYQLTGLNGTKELTANLGEFVDNAVSLSNAFNAQTPDKIPSFVNALTKNKTASTLIGLGICAALCIAIQPINRYLTKKRTGKDAFVGVDENQGDNSKGFKTLKTVMGVGFPAFAISTIGKPADFISNVQFNSKIPTLKQFKFLYGLTIGSRFMSARDGNELREGVIKDFLGFTNWLILGGMVSKLTARKIGGQELINNPIAQQNGKKGVKYAFDWLRKASVKSYDEVLLPNVQNIVKDGKLESFASLFKKADSATKAKVCKIAVSQVAGYVYSGLVLGVGIAKLNIAITKFVHSRKKAKENMQNKIDEKSGFKYDMTYITNVQNQLNSVFKDFS